MGKNLYNGESFGLSGVVDGYVEYANEVITNRALPDLRDGFKTVQRRALWTALRSKDMREGQIGSVRYMGDVSKIHPHDESSIYDAITRLVQTHEGVTVPLFNGKGNYSKVYMDEPAASPRYTSIGLHKNAFDFWGERDGMEWQEDEMGEGDLEPTALPASYPNLLTLGSAGLAVAVATDIPSFNFWDVLNLLEKHVRGGELGEEDIIYPDYAVGGNYIVNRDEMYKVMLTGRGRIRHRAEVNIVGKQIFVTELPVGKVDKKIAHAISKGIAEKDADFSTIVSATEAVAAKSQNKVIITCRSAAATEDALMSLYRRGILQVSASSNIVALNDKIPVIGGVYRIIAEWAKWRGELLERQFKYDLESLTVSEKRLSYFIRLIENEEWKTEYIRRITKVSLQQASAYLREIFDDVPEDVVTWIGERRASTFLNGGKYKVQHTGIVREIAEVEAKLADITSVMLADIERLRREHRGRHERRTRLSHTDYVFSSRQAESKTEERAAAAAVAVPAFFTIYRNGFMKKTPTKQGDVGKDILAVVEGKSTDTLIGFDNAGRILRYYGDDDTQDYTTGSGIYLPRYFGVPDDLDEMYKLLWFGPLDGREHMLLFTDGMVSFLDTKRWLGVKARHKIVNGGVNEMVNGLLLDVIPEEDYPEVLFVADKGRDKIRFSTMAMDEIVKPGSAKGRRKVFRGSDVTIAFWGNLPKDMYDSWHFAGNVDAYKGRVKSLPGDDFNKVSNVDILDILNEPTYTS